MGCGGLAGRPPPAPRPTTIVTSSALAPPALRAPSCSLRPPYTSSTFTPAPPPSGPLPERRQLAVAVCQRLFQPVLPRVLAGDLWQEVRPAGRVHQKVRAAGGRPRGLACAQRGPRCAPVPSYTAAARAAPVSTCVWSRLLPCTPPHTPKLKPTPKPQPQPTPTPHSWPSTRPSTSTSPGRRPSRCRRPAAASSAWTTPSPSWTTPPRASATWSA